MKIFFGAVSKIVSKASTKPLTKLGDKFTLLPNVDDDNDTIGVTGLGYNTKTDEYIVSYYSYDKEAKLWFYGRNSDNLLEYSPTGTLEPTPDREIDLTNIVDHLQGNTYDSVDDCYWILGTEKNASLNDSNRVLIKLSLTGSVLEEYKITNSGINIQVGMVVHNPVTDTLLIKGNDNTTLWEIDKDDKSVIRTETCHTQYEGLGLDIDRQIIWIGGDEGTIKAHSWDDFEELYSGTFETLEDGGENIEQILVDPVDGRICIGFDAWLHGNNNNGNAMFKFDFGGNIKN